MRKRWTMKQLHHIWGTSSWHVTIFPYMLHETISHISRSLTCCILKAMFKIAAHLFIVWLSTKFRCHSAPQDLGWSALNCNNDNNKLLKNGPYFTNLSWSLFLVHLKIIPSFLEALFCRATTWHPTYETIFHLMLYFIWCYLPKTLWAISHWSLVVDSWVKNPCRSTSFHNSWRVFYLHYLPILGRNLLSFSGDDDMMLRLTRLQMELLQLECI